MLMTPEKNGSPFTSRLAQQPMSSTYSSTSTAIATHNLLRVFGQKAAVNHLNLTIQRGEFYGFLGPNGAGKSTTIKMLTGLLRPTAGTAYVAGVNVWQDPLQARAMMGVLPEYLNLYERLSGREFLIFAGHMYGVPEADIRRRSEELLHILTLTDDADKLIVDYSLGMRKKIALAAALIHRPHVLFLDEPGWVFWLGRKFVTAGFSRRQASLVQAIVLLLIVLWGAGTIAVVTFVAYRNLTPSANSEVLYLVLTGVLLIWIMLPLLEFTGNEGLDVSKLALFPLTRAELMASLLFSTLLDIPTIGLVLVLAAVIAGWAVSVPVAILAFFTMLIFYVLVVGVSQLVLALFMSTLQSRRFRDLSIIIVAVFASSCYLVEQFVLGGARFLHFTQSLQSSTYSPYLQWLPSGVAARSILMAIQGNWGASLAWLGLLLVITVVVLYLWQLVLERSLSSPEVSCSARVRNRRRQQA